MSQTNLHIDKPSISIIVPLYNAEQYIRRCIESLVHQSVKEIEILLIDDGGSDRSTEIAGTYAAQEHRIRILHHEKNMGAMWARQTGYQAARGKYITFVDSDDELPHNALESLLRIAECTKADIVAGQVKYLEKYRNRIFPSHLKYGNDKISIYKSLLRKELIHGLWGKLYKRSLFDGIQYETHEHFSNGEDSLLLYQIIDQSPKIACVDDIVYHYYRNSTSSTEAWYEKGAAEHNIYMLNWRYNKLKKYPELIDDLNARTIMDLCWISSKGVSIDAINKMLSEQSSVPLKLNVYEIISRLSWRHAIKGLTQCTILSIINHHKRSQIV